MGRAIVFILLLASVESSVVRTYHFISLYRNWYDAQTYCRKHHTDLAFVDNDLDHEEILRLGGNKGWLGLFREVTNETGWRWSGGDHITFAQWKSGHPDNKDGNETSGVLENGVWVDKESMDTYPFYCVTLAIRDDMKKPWEEALDFCWRNLTELGQPSPTVLHLTQRMMQQQGIDRVWIALRYLGNSWQWVSSGNTLEHQHQAWRTGADLDIQCPLTHRCGTLTMDGLWEAWDCKESLYFFCK